MNRNALYVMLFASFMIGCNPMNDPLQQANDSLTPLRLTVSLNEELLPFNPESKAMPPLFESEPIQNKSGSGGEENPDNSEKELQELCLNLEYVVLDREDANAIVKHKSYNVNDEDFGIIYDSLPAGSYTIAVLAHSTVVELQSTGVFDLDSIKDMFHLAQDIDVERGTEVVEDIELKRIVGRIEFVSKEAVRSNFKSFSLEIDDYPLQVDMLTGKGIQNEESYFKTYVFQTEDLGVMDKAYNFLTLVPGLSGNLNVDLVMVDTSDKEINRRSVLAILPQANRTIRYTGNLYTPTNSEDTFIITVEEGGRWGEDIDHELND